GGIGGGISKSADQLEKFYLQLAEQTLPIIQVGATKTVTVVISEGINLEVKDATIIN
ncbi:MAG: conjugal transfer protein TraB, partial [Desulfobacteraceae bacterium]